MSLSKDTVLAILAARKSLRETSQQSKGITMSEPMKQIAVGDRVVCEFPSSYAGRGANGKSYSPDYRGVVVGPGYADCQWRIKRDGYKHTEIVHQIFISLEQYCD